MTTSNSNLGAWIARLRDPDPTVTLKDRLDEVDREALDSAIGFSAEHTRRYIATGGADDGWDGPRPILILYTRGRRSGQLRRNPLVYIERNHVAHVIGSYGGSENHPQWYLNLEADPEVYVRVNTEVYSATARTLAEPEHDELWPGLVEEHPMFGDYQANTTRRIPIVALDPTAAPAS